MSYINPPDNKYWFQSFGLSPELHDKNFLGTPNGTNHAVFEAMFIIPTFIWMWHLYHNPLLLLFVWGGSVLTWIGLELWQARKGAREGWSIKDWWNIFKWNTSRHHDWIAPTIFPITLTFVMIGTLLNLKAVKKSRHIQLHNS